jgi:hypothetical protein
MRATFGRDATPASDPGFIAHAAGTDPRLSPRAPRRRPVPRVAMIWILVAAVGSIPLWWQLRHHDHAAQAAEVHALEPAHPLAPAALPPPPPLTPPTLAPEEKAQLDQLLGDIWLHPLAGPTRRMPIRDGRLFGAERLGDRPAECMGGHCGVDVGGTYGEPVYAVHDGVVDRVVRYANEDHGGHYVRILHRERTIVSQYFHLSSIPRNLQAGVAVKAGDLVGWVGRSGVKHSGPHLHFTIAVQDASGQNARYIDPEPLIALWPLKDAGPDGKPQVDANVPAGLARGFVRRHFRHPHLSARSTNARHDVAD